MFTNDVAEIKTSIVTLLRDKMQNYLAVKFSFNNKNLYDRVHIAHNHVVKIFCEVCVCFINVFKNQTHR
jgi:hypothetical protein